MGYFDLKRNNSEGGDAIAPHAATHHEGGVDSITPEAIGAETEGAAAAAIAVHTAQANPHSQYLKEVSWSIISGLPPAFPPIAHNHLWGEISSIPATASRWPTWGEVGDKPETFAPSSHSHPIIAAATFPNILNNSFLEISGLTIGMLFVYARNSAYQFYNCILTYRVNLGSNFIRLILKDATNIAVALGVPNGSTGNSGNLTFFGGSDGKIYVENRTGGTISLGYHAINN